MQPPTTWSESLLLNLLNMVRQRCAFLKWNAAESDISTWANNNFPAFWSEVKQAALYCDVHLKPHAGFLRTEGSAINLEAKAYLVSNDGARQKQMSLHEFVSSIKHFEKEIDLLVRSAVVEGRLADSNLEDMPVDTQINGSALANGGDADPDGPVEGYRWRHNGRVVEVTLQPKAWKLVHFLWHLRTGTANIFDLAQPIYGDPNHEVTENAISSLRKRANIYFENHDIPLLVSVKQGTVNLEVLPVAEQG